MRARVRDARGLCVVHMHPGRAKPVAPICLLHSRIRAPRCTDAFSTSFLAELYVSSVLSKSSSEEELSAEELSWGLGYWALASICMTIPLTLINGKVMERNKTL